MGSWKKHSASVGACGWPQCSSRLKRRSSPPVTTMAMPTSRCTWMAPDCDTSVVTSSVCCCRATTGEAESFRDRFFPGKQTVALADLPHAGTAGWSWAELFESLGWDPQGAAVSDVCRYIGHDPGERRANGNPASGFEPIQPRVYSTCGVEPGAARLLVTIPRDIDAHYGFQRITVLGLRRVPIAFSPCTAFLRPPADANLLLVATVPASRRSSASCAPLPTTGVPARWSTSAARRHCFGPISKPG